MSKQTETVSGFTPGPWAYHLGRGANPRFHIQAEGGYQIASTTELTTPKTAKLAIDFEENQAREANARLIAAAPAMFEALQALLRFTDNGIDAYGADKHKVKSHIVGNARAALAQAQGKPI